MTTKTFSTLAFLLGFCYILTAQQISTNSGTSLETLIQTTLGQGCVKISNISSTINGSVDNLSSYGRFTKENSNFPFQNGLVLTTGNVISAGNTLNTNPLNEGTDSWGTDADLESALGISNTMNATSIEFDFISAANGISFNYLLASEEYLGNNPCKYSDGFAFLIKEVGSTDPYRNIALIPGSSLPVNTKNIHPEINGFCPAENPSYFQGYNLGDTNYNGRTIVLTASADIIPNEAYHIKIVIADQEDPNLDSAVFIEGNSFNSTVDLGPDILTCAQSTILKANVENLLTTYKWFRNGGLIAEATSPSLNVTQSGTYKVRAGIPLDGNSCEVEDEIVVTLNVQQSLANIPDYILCDDPSNDGKEFFDLSTRNDEVLQNLSPSEYSITYHLTSAEAQAGSNPITKPIQNTENPQDIFIRVTDVINDCVSLSGVQLIVNQPPPINAPDPYEICDADGVPDGFTQIDLSQFDSEIKSNAPESSSLFVSYHINPADANSGDNPLFSPYTNTGANQTIYVRLYDSSTGCFSRTTLDITVFNPPNITIEKPFINACNQNGNGFAIFDLASELQTILAGLTSVSASIHETYKDAEVNTNAITNTTNYQNIQADFQELYIRVVNNLTGCFTIVPLELHTNIAETGTTIDEAGFNTGEFNGCDNFQNGIVDFDLNSVEQQLRNNYEGVDVVFFESQNDQQTNTNPLDKTIPYTVPSRPPLIYATVTISGCSEFIPIKLVINPPVVLQSSFSLEYCGRNQDAEVFLQTFDADISYGITAPVVQYYETQQDALDDENALGPNIKVYRKKNIYVRVTNSQTSCYDVAPLTITILDAPIISERHRLFDCNADQNGYAYFDLESSIPFLVPDTTGVTITFHTNSNFAVAGTNPIQAPSDFYSRSQYIAVRVENEKGCFSVAALYLIANSLPIIPQISNFQNCTSDNSDIADFYFYEKDDEITNGQNNKEVLYFETAQDAAERVNIIDKFSAYNNTPTISQTIYVRVEAANDTNCYATSSFVLEVDNLPSFNEATDEFLCDDFSNDGFVTLDLNAKDEEIRRDISDEITFYTSDEDARNKKNRITNYNFTNTANPQSITARIDNGTFCYSLTSFSINVVPLPQVEAPSDLYFCDSALNGPGVYNLEVVKILDLRPENIIITYHESLEGADADTQIISDPKNYTSTSNPQTIYAKINNTLSDLDCYVTLPINLNIVLPPSVTDFKQYSICPNPDNYFDLTTVDSVLTSEPNIHVTYFNSSGDAIANDTNNTLDTDYTYISQKDRIYARLENTLTGCITYYNFELVINPLPVANMPTDLYDCDDDFDGALVFDLSQQSESILGGQDPLNFTVTYHSRLNDANNGINMLENSYVANNGQTIYARVSNNATGCFSTTQFTTIVHPKPIIDITDQAICIDNLPLIVSADTNNAGESYQWSTGETTPEIEIQDLGSYYVTVTSSFGCQSNKEFEVVESESAVIESVETIDFSDPNNITITVSGSGNYFYILDGGPPQESNVFENVTLGYHTITVIDLNGCREVSKEVVVIDAPKFMTPNNDGYFDTWHISGIETLPGSIIYIYDRYGKLLTTLNSSSKGWDGTYKGSRMPSSDYWFLGKIKKNDNTFEVKGHFTLKL